MFCCAIIKRLKTNIMQEETMMNNKGTSLMEVIVAIMLFGLSWTCLTSEIHFIKHSLQRQKIQMDKMYALEAVHTAIEDIAKTTKETTLNYSSEHYNINVQCKTNSSHNRKYKYCTIMPLTRNVTSAEMPETPIIALLRTR